MQSSRIKNMNTNKLCNCSPKCSYLCLDGKNTNKNTKVEQELNASHEKHVITSIIKGQVHCFSMQVVMNKCFLLNVEKKFDTDLSCHFRQNATLIPKNYVTKPKARLL